MTFEHFQAHWITSSSRTALLNALHAEMSKRLTAALHGMPIAGLAAELSTAALMAVDEQLAKPIQIEAGKVTIRDHRG